MTSYQNKLERFSLSAASTLVYYLEARLKAIKLRVKFRKGLHSRGRLLALPINMILRQKRLTVTTTLAYYITIIYGCKKFTNAGPVFLLILKFVSGKSFVSSKALKWRQVSTIHLKIYYQAFSQVANRNSKCSFRKDAKNFFFLILTNCLKLFRQS